MLLHNLIIQIYKKFVFWILRFLLTNSHSYCIVNLVSITYAVYGISPLFCTASVVCRHLSDERSNYEFAKWSYNSFQLSEHAAQRWIRQPRWAVQKSLCSERTDRGKTCLCRFCLRFKFKFIQIGSHALW